MTTRSALFLFCVSTACSGCTNTPDSANKTPPPSSIISHSLDSASFPGTFAFVDTTGTAILALRSIPGAASIRRTVCINGRSFRIRYVRRQDEHPETTHRQVAENFSKEGGDVFQLLGDTAEPNETCFISGDSLLLQRAAAVRPLDRTPCHHTEVASLARIAGREAIHCWHFGQIPGGAKVIAVQFTTIDTSALAGLALVLDNVLLFHALPGHYRGPDESIWRVDDGGIFDPDLFRFLFAAQLPRGYALAFGWAGAEGESDQLIVADSTVHARAIVVDYRYWSPL